MSEVPVSRINNVPAKEGMGLDPRGKVSSCLGLLIKFKGSGA